MQISNNDLGQAASKFFDTDPANLKSLLLNSEAKWDETAFGGAGYGHEDAALPSMCSGYIPKYVRTCKHVDPLNGRWRIERYGLTLSASSLQHRLRSRS